MRPLVLKGHQRGVNVVKLNYDGDLLFSGSADSIINVWQAYTGQRLGSYKTKSAVKSLDVDVDSKYLLYVSYAGFLQMFQVQSGKLIKFVRLPNKLKQIQFNLGCSKLLILQDSFEINKPSQVVIYDFQQFLNIPTKKQSNQDTLQIDHTKLIPKLKFDTILEQNNSSINRIATKALWYVDNQQFFASTNKGQIIRYDSKGKYIKGRIIHPDSQINSFNFSKDYSILATAAGDGCKIVDPQTLQVLKYFKQEYPMNSISVSPLFCDEKDPKYHIIIGGGILAIHAAMSKGKGGFEAILCNVMYEKQVGKVAGHFGPINTIQFFKDGRGYISGGQDSFIRAVRFNESYFDNPMFQ